MNFWRSDSTVLDQTLGKGEQQMSSRLDKSWTVFVSVENLDYDRCVDFFSRPDGTFGFEEFRRDVEDAGAWTPVQYYSGIAYAVSGAALGAAERTVPWLTDTLAKTPSLREQLSQF